MWLIFFVKMCIIEKNRIWQFLCWTGMIRLLYVQWLIVFLFVYYKIKCNFYHFIFLKDLKRPCKYCRKKWWCIFDFKNTCFSIKTSFLYSNSRFWSHFFKLLSIFVSHLNQFFSYPSKSVFPLWISFLHHTGAHHTSVVIITLWNVRSDPSLACAQMCLWEAPLVPAVCVRLYMWMRLIDFQFQFLCTCSFHQATRWDWAFTASSEIVPVLLDSQLHLNALKE